MVSPELDLPRLGLPNRYPGGTKPDIRLSLGNGKEAVWDITSAAVSRREGGHALHGYGSNKFIDYLADLTYELP